MARKGSFPQGGLQGRKKMKNLSREYYVHISERGRVTEAAMEYLTAATAGNRDQYNYNDVEYDE